MFRDFIFIIAAFFLLPNAMLAQQQVHELGVKVGYGHPTLSINMLYKKHINENLYRRYSLELPNITFSTAAKYTNAGARLDFSFGKEKRMPIGSKLNFIHGLQYSSLLDYSRKDGSYYPDGSFQGIRTIDNSINAFLGIGYLLGTKFAITPSLSMSLEAIPNVYVGYGFGSYKFGDSNTDIGVFGLYANALHKAGLSLFYTFEGQKK